MNTDTIEVPVALVFFARPDVLKQTFEAIRNARPTKLFLIQDGSRPNRNDDIENIRKCQVIVSNIDWDCEVHKNYSETNLGCGMRMFSGITWAFQFVDRLIIIEDDCVVSKSFFKLCEILLERYLTDERIDMISGMNHIGKYDKIDYDYFFTTAASPWGWATWKRVWDSIDYNMDFFKDSDTLRLIRNLHGNSFLEEGEKKFNQIQAGKKISSWTYQKGVSTFLNSRINIVPRYNLTSNIGLTENGANSVNSIRLIPKGLRRVYFMETYEIEFPLKHPKYVINDIEYKKKVDRIMAVGYPIISMFRLFESVIYRILNGDIKSLLKGLRRRFSNI